MSSASRRGILARSGGARRMTGAAGGAMDRDTLADRIVSYSDAIVAFSMVNGLGFLIALGDPDMRCSIVEVAAVLGGVNGLFAIFGTAGLFWLRRFERALRGVEADDPLIVRFMRLSMIVRVALIWVFCAVVVFGVFAGSFDARCGLASVAAP